MSSHPPDNHDLNKKSKQELIKDLVRAKNLIRQYEEQTDNTNVIDRLLIVALDVFPDVVICYDENEKIVFTNDAYHTVYPHSPPKNKIAGCTQEHLLRCSLNAGLIAHPMAKTDPEGWLQMRLEERRNMKGSFVGETTHSTGRTYLYRHRITPAGACIIIQSDITARKDAEQKVIRANKELEQHVEQRTKELQESDAKFREYSLISSDWFWEMDDCLRFKYFSDRNREITGFDPSIYIGKTRREIAAGRTTEEKWIKHLDDLDDHKPFRDFEYDLTRIDGDRLTISVSGKPVFDQTGKFLGYRGTGSDITAHRVAEEARDEAWREADQANQAKSEFLATMSHEFRTPLNAILGFSGMMQEQFFGPLGSEIYVDYTNDIHRSGEHMLTLVNDVLDIAAIEAGQRFMSNDTVEVNNLLNDCIRSVETAARDANIELMLDVPDAPLYLHADNRSLYQVMLNLLSNAIKFTDQNGTIWITVKGSDQKIEIYVKDTGIGIPADKLPSITEPFSQSHADPHRTQEGTGLGLSIVKSLVEEHGGELNIKSELNKGTTVTVSFPLR